VKTARNEFSKGQRISSVFANDLDPRANPTLKDRKKYAAIIKKLVADVEVQKSYWDALFLSKDAKMPNLILLLGSITKTLRAKSKIKKKRPKVANGITWSVKKN